MRLTPWHRWCGRSDEHLIEFVANNVDRHNISFHSLFYKLSLHAPAQPPSGSSGPAATALTALSELDEAEAVRGPADRFITIN